MDSSEAWSDDGSRIPYDWDENWWIVKLEKNVVVRECVREVFNELNEDLYD
jgi:hypothetical protein